MRKGFTLIELLAVIVILGIIGLITSPLIGGVIQNSKKGAFEDSVYGIIKSVDLDKAESGFNINRTYTVVPGSVISNTTGLPLETKGSVNGNGIVKLDEDGNIQLTIEYDVWCATKEYENKAIEIRPAPCVPNSDPLVNNPWLLNNMVPVKWNGSAWIVADKRNPESNKWYNYTEKQWANSALVTQTNRDYYTSDAAIGSVVNSVDLLGLFVWIPRFNYGILPSNEITINFENGVPTKANGSGVNTSFLTHPAFTFGEKELTGFWFAKFETTGNLDNITVLPNTLTLNTASVMQMYNKVTELALPNNIYGFTTARVDIRITKNVEWGAVSYLTNSAYGRCTSGTCTTVRRNNSIPNRTGCAGSDLYSAIASCSNIYSTANGQQSSTTANIYGVYDMAGGGFDVVMANYLETPARSGMTNFPNLKYYDRFTQININTACSGSPCKGQALSETDGWYGGSQIFVTQNDPWLVRGSTSTLSTISSIYSYTRWDGIGSGGVTYRLTFSNR
jgi:prepilin-type N-terminal cleavage/methylation domain-containing protein